MGVIEKNVPQVEPMGRFVFQRVQAVWLVESAAFACLMVKDIQKLKEDHPRHLFVVKPMSPNRLIHPHRRRLVEVIGRRQWLKDRGTKPVIPNRSNRKQPFSFDKKSYKQRHRIENAFGRLKDFRRIATRYDRLARNFLASVCLVAAIVWWIL